MVTRENSKESQKKTQMVYNTLSAPTFNLRSSSRIAPDPTICPSWNTIISSWVVHVLGLTSDGSDILILQSQPMLLVNKRLEKLVHFWLTFTFRRFI